MDDSFSRWQSVGSAGDAFRDVRTDGGRPVLDLSTRRRTDCVVDGDTFWFRGEKTRIAYIDTTELSPPRCQREAELGEAAQRRLQALLYAGPFTLVAGTRDQDQ